MTGTGSERSQFALTFSPASQSFWQCCFETLPARNHLDQEHERVGGSAITSISGSGYFTAAPGGNTPCGSTLNAGASCTVTVTYTPLVLGSNIAGVTVVSNASITTEVQNVSGSGILAVTMSPTSISFWDSFGGKHEHG